MSYLLTFSSTTYSLQAERVLLASALDAEMQPLPSAIHAGCGLCISISTEDLKQAQEALRKGNTPIENLYLKHEASGAAEYSLCDVS